MEQPRRYDEFWGHYLRAHRAPATRLVHYAGSLAALALLILALALRDWRPLVAAPVVGYAAAWFGHFVFEGNRPATFGHPFWSLYSDFRMLFLWLSFRLEPHLRRSLD